MRGLSSSLHRAFSERADAEDMATLKAWLASAALLGGAGGGAAAGLAATGDPTQPVAATRPVAGPDTGQLQQQIDALLREDHSLQRAVHRARLRLAGQVHAGEQSLAALHRRIVAAQAQLAAAQAARTQVTPVTTTVVAPAATPVAHATTGASGAGSHGEHEGGHDD